MSHYVCGAAPCREVVAKAFIFGFLLVTPGAGGGSQVCPSLLYEILINKVVMELRIIVPQPFVTYCVLAVLPCMPAYRVHSKEKLVVGLGC